MEACVKRYGIPGKICTHALHRERERERARWILNSDWRLVWARKAAWQAERRLAPPILDSPGLPVQEAPALFCSGLLSSSSWWRSTLLFPPFCLVQELTLTTCYPVSPGATRQGQTWQVWGSNYFCEVPADSARWHIVSIIVCISRLGAPAVSIIYWCSDDLTIHNVTVPGDRAACYCWGKCSLTPGMGHGAGTMCHGSSIQKTMRAALYEASDAALQTVTTCQC